jgi:predicted HAD superfamily hydrolase
LAFSDWLLKESTQRGIKKIFFLSREGLILKKIYDIWVSEKETAPVSEYLVLSRRSVSVPRITTIEDIYNIARLDYQKNPAEIFFFERFGLELSSQEWDLLEKKNLFKKTNGIHVMGNNIEHLKPLLNELAPRIFEIAQRERLALSGYLDNMGLPREKSAVLVDVGYSASIQSHLNEGFGLTLGGLYLMTRDAARVKIADKNIPVLGFLHENIRANEVLQFPAVTHSFELEKLLSSDTPQVLNYTFCENGRIERRERPLIAEEIKAQPLRHELQSGLLEYVKDYKNYASRLDFASAPSRKFVLEILSEFFGHLTDKEQQILKSIPLDDFYCGRGIVY